MFKEFGSVALERQLDAGLLSRQERLISSLFDIVQLEIGPAWSGIYHSGRA
jgi:hypothetical protein